MSQVEYEGNGLPEEDEENTNVQGSLAARMRGRAQELERQVTETFDIPGWEDILAVELRLMPWATLRGIGQRNRKVKQAAIQELYTAADSIITATEQFYEVAGEHKTPLEESWITLAKRTGRPLPEDLTQRQAVIALVGDTRVMVLYNEWSEWMQGERRDVDEEVMRDFRMTPSHSSSTTQ